MGSANERERRSVADRARPCTSAAIDLGDRRSGFPTAAEPEAIAASGLGGAHAGLLPRDLPCKSGGPLLHCLRLNMSNSDQF